MAALAACLIAGLLPTACRKGGASTRPAVAPAAASAKPAETAALPTPKVLSEFDAFSALGYQPQWVGYPVLPKGQKIQFFDPFADLVVAQASGNLLTAMDAATGANRWSQSMGTGLTKFVGNVRRSNGDLICSSQGEVFVLEPETGIIKDRQRLAVIANTRPVSVDNVLIYGCPTGEVLGHSLGSGYKLWGYMLDGAITAPPTKVGGSVAVVSQRGELVILDPREGSAVGRGRLYGGLANSPVAGDQTIFLASLDQSLWAYEEYGREAKWRVRFEHPLRDQPTYHDGRLYSAIPREGVVCFDATNGRRIWTIAGATGSVVAVRAGRPILWDGSTIMAIDPAFGEVVERLSLPGIDRIVPDSLVDGNLYTLSTKGEVRKYSPKR